jgi:hypothetical protein
MKGLICMFLFVALSSCASSYYQISELGSADVQISDSLFVYETESKSGDIPPVSIIYDFWGEGGSSDLLIENHSNRMLTIDLGKTHIVYNGYTFDYFGNYEYQESGSALFSSGAFVQSATHSSYSAFAFGSRKQSVISSSASVSSKEKEFLNIPPHSKRYLEGFKLTGNIYKACNLKLFPDKSNLISKDNRMTFLEYSESNSPTKIKIFSHFWMVIKVFPLKTDFISKKSAILPEKIFSKKRI